MSELRPEVLQLARLVNDQIDAQEESAAQRGYANYWTLDVRTIWEELDDALGSLTGWIEDGERWKATAGENRAITEGAIRYNAFLLCALGKALGVLEDGVVVAPEVTP